MSTNYLIDTKVCWDDEKESIMVTMRCHINAKDIMEMNFMWGAPIEHKDGIKYLKDIACLLQTSRAEFERKIIERLGGDCIFSA